MNDLPRAAPFIRWVGGKGQLLPELLKHVPERFTTYCEPFLGGGALFFELVALGRIGPLTSVLLSDVNVPLIRTYRALQGSLGGVVAQLLDVQGHHERDPAGYYKRIRGISEDDLTRLSDVEVAAWFLYLNRNSFNGLWRVNQKGIFNVPRDAGKKGKLVTSESVLRLQAASTALQGHRVEIRSALTASAGPGAFVYFDPPYIPVASAKTKSFTAYAKSPFGVMQQRLLHDHALGLARAGAHVVLSNSDTEATRALYSEKDWTLHEVRARRNVNSDASKRGTVGELIIVGRN